jgi:hypothetical protein
MEGASQYSIKVANYTVNGTREGVSVVTFRRNEYPKITESLQIDSNGEYIVQGEVAIVLFYSDETLNSGGFTATVSRPANSSLANMNSTNIVFTEYDENLPYPNTTEPYKVNELSTFVYSPRSRRSPGISKRLDYTLLGYEESCQCCDSLAVYLFYGYTGIYEWIMEAQLCNGDKTYSIINPDMILMVFHSDASTPGVGFNATLTQV